MEEPIIGIYGSVLAQCLNGLNGRHPLLQHEIRTCYGGWTWDAHEAVHQDLSCQFVVFSDRKVFDKDLDWGWIRRQLHQVINLEKQDRKSDLKSWIDTNREKYNKYLTFIYRVRKPITQNIKDKGNSHFISLPISLLWWTKPFESCPFLILIYFQLVEIPCSLLQWITVMMVIVWNRYLIIPECNLIP